MTVQEKPVSKASVFPILLLILLALVAVASIVIVVCVPFPQPSPEPSAVTQPPVTEPVQTPTEPPETEPTLPPPPASAYGPNDFQFNENNYLYSKDGKSRLGIDISDWQTVYDWNAVKESGVEFVIIRAGFRGYGQGTLNPDADAQAHYEGARSVGLPVGVYFFSQAITVEEAQEEANYTLELIADWDVDLPIIFDWEYVNDEARTANITGPELMDMSIAYFEIIEEAGYTPMAYFNRTMSKNMLELEKLTDYNFWLAMYSNRMTFPYAVDYWQYSCTGQVPGIEGPVDMNIWFPDELLQDPPG